MSACGLLRPHFPFCRLCTGDTVQTAEQLGCATHMHLNIHAHTHLHPCTRAHPHACMHACARTHASIHTRYFIQGCALLEAARAGHDAVLEALLAAGAKMSMSQVGLGFPV